MKRLARAPIGQRLARTMMMVALAAGCSRPGGTSDSSDAAASGRGESATVILNGAGATFPFPLYSKWMDVYNKAHPGVRINYQSIGSGGGIRQITERTVDFGASDAPMTDEELAKAPGPILHVPMTLGAVALTYNVPEVKTKLRVTADIIAGIFLGEITRWNDDKIASDNPGVKLPASPITVVHRSDGSGTTAILTEYLSSVVPRWKEKVGAGKSVRFPVGLGAKGNEGVSGQMRTTPGSFGYAELAYAIETGLSYASVRNTSDNDVEPTIDAITAAAATLSAKLPEDMRAFVVNAPGANAYPLSAFSYILVYREQPDKRKGKMLAEFLWWAVHEGQKYGAPLHYAPLPPDAVGRVERQLRTMKAEDQALLGSL
jgi:phosphate transport system substrate-binding protein